MKKNQISAYITLFVVLLVGVIIDIFPILSINSLSPKEIELSEMVCAMRGQNIEIIFNNTLGIDIITRIYAYFVRLLSDIFIDLDPVFLLRLPSAALTMTLILCLFRFDGTSEKLGNSFIASLVFMACSFVSVFCFRASPILIPAVLTILSLVSLFHWLRRPTKRNSLLLSLALGANIILLGFLAIFIVLVVASLFLSTTRLGTFTNWAKLAGTIILSSAFSFLAVFVITGEREFALNIFNNVSMLQSINSDRNSAAEVFMGYAIFAMFPWSLPLLASLVWVIRNYTEVKSKFINLKLLQRFGASIFLITLPFLWFYSQFSFTLLMACVFFNSPLIGKTLISQFNHHPAGWRITGKICAVCVTFIDLLYIILNLGVKIPYMPFQFSPHSWSVWSIALLCSMAVSLYTLSRNTREVARNNRYFYNIIVLYLLAQNLFIGYILPNISID